MNTLTSSYENKPALSEKKSNAPLVLSFLLIFIVAFALGAVVLSYFSSEQVPASDNTQEKATEKQAEQPPPAANTFAPLAASQFKAYPYAQGGQLTIIPIDPTIEPFLYTGVRIAHGGGAMGRGDSDPQASPDLEKIAFIDDSGRLHLLSADGKSDVVVSEKIGVGFITGWSSDSQKLIVYSEAATLESTFLLDGPVPEDQRPQNAKFEKNGIAGGFYLIDLENQSLSYLAPLGNSEVHGWIDQSRILTNISGFDKEYVIFNVDTYQADASILSEEIEADFATQFSFNQDGSKWARTWHGGTGTAETASIVLADFPANEGTLLKQAGFAEVQWAKISPDGTKVIFMETPVVNESDYVSLYDGSGTRQLFAGRPVQWVDNESFIYLVDTHLGPNDPGNKVEYFIYNLSSQESVLLFSSSQ